MKRFFITAALILLTASNVLADENGQLFMLKDGTLIKGKLVNVINGSYTISSPTMGQIQVPAAQVQSITSANAEPSASSSPLVNGKISPDMINSYKTNMMQDPEIMSLIQDLIKDPEVAQIMKDPSLMQAALSMDPQKIQNNPDVQKLIQNPTMQKILKLTAEKLQTSGSK